MDSGIKQEMEIVEREACYLIDTIEHALERIVNYNDLNEKELKYLSKLLDLDDENLYKFNVGKKTSIKIDINKVSDLFKDFI